MLAVLVLAVTGVDACGETTGVILGEVAGDAPVEAPPLADGGTSLQVVLSGESATAQQGGTTGTPYTDVCPGNQAVIGYRGFLTGPQVGATLVGAIQTVCGQLSMNGASPASMTTAAGATLPMRGTAQDMAWTQMCPADEVVVGFSGRSGADLDQVAFDCAPWIAQGGTGGALAVGTAIPSTAAGGDGGTPFQDDLCPSGQLARGSNLRAGAWVDAFGLVCGTPTLAP